MKVLFITSQDFGELGLATFFSRNQPFQSVFVVPVAKRAYFDEVVDLLYTYSTVTELERLIDREKPDVISLNTGYLIVNGGLATMADFQSFYAYLKTLNCPIITTDPFVRVYDSYPECSFALNGRALDNLKAEMSFLNEFLKDLPHVYGFPSSCGLEAAYSFYNDRFCSPEKKCSEESANRNQWFFVLGELDSKLLLEKYGEDFIRILANRLVEVCGNPDNTVFCVFPKNIADTLRELFTPLKNIQVMDYVSLNEFETLVRTSDVVFYWNVFSNSILLCYYYDVPFLCFDKGHIANLSEDLFNHMSEGIYRSGKPEFIDFFEPMEPSLDDLLEKHFSRENRQRILDEYRRLPSPQTVLETVTRCLIPN